MTRPGTGTDLEQRTLPHNLDAERSVIGAVLLRNAAYLDATKQIRAVDFFRQAHRTIYGAIERALDASGGVVDLVTLRAALAARGELDEVGGPAYLASLIDGVPHSVNISHYAGLVREASLLRALIKTGSEVMGWAYAAEDPAADILSRADRAIVDLQRGIDSGRMRSTAASHAALMETLEWRVQHRGELSGIETGFASINGITGGWQAGDMIVIAARPSMGKTTLAMNSAWSAALTGARVAIFSLEMRRLQLELRLLSALSGVAFSVLLGGWVRDEQWPAVSEALAAIREAPIWIDDAASRTVWDIRSACRRLKADGGLGLVVVDYIQLMQGSTEQRGANRNTEITDISRRLKVLADELAVPILVLSQLNRAAEGRADPRPKLSDLRESGSLEQDADLVCFLHRKHHREGGATEFILEKQRNGPTGTVIVTLERECTRFIDGGEMPAETAAERQTEDQDARTRAFIRRRSR